MAYRNAPIHGLSVKQMKLIVKARNTPGVHAYYPGGYEASVTSYFGQMWSHYREANCVSMYLIRCRKLSPYGFQFGNVSDNIRLSFDAATIRVSKYSGQTLQNEVSTVPSIGSHVVEIRGNGSTGEIFIDGIDVSNVKYRLSGTIVTMKLGTLEPDKWFISDGFEHWENHFYGPGIHSTSLSNTLLFLGGFARFEPGCHVVYHVKNEKNLDAKISYCLNYGLHSIKPNAAEQGAFVFTATGLYLYLSEPPSVAPFNLPTDYAITAMWTLSQPLIVFDLTWSAIASDSIYRVCPNRELNNIIGCDIHPVTCLEASAGSGF